MYRKGVGIVLINNKGQVFVGKRIIDKNNKNLIAKPWQMPQGGVDEGESDEEALSREVEEEIGLKQADFKILKKANQPYRYNLPEDLLQKFWNGKYKGQEQIWFCCLLTSPENKINIKTTHPEFENWKWISPYSISSIAVNFKLDMYNKIFAEFFQTIILTKNLS